MKKKDIIEKLNNKNVSFNEFYDYCLYDDNAYWDNVNNIEVIKKYIIDMVNKGVDVSHILYEIEQNNSKYDLFEIWLGNSMITPKSINSKKDLYNALYN